MPKLNKRIEIEKKQMEILEDLFKHYWWNVRGFGYRCNNSEELEKEMLALALKPFLDNQIRKPQSKMKIDIMKKLKEVKQDA